MPEDDHGLVPTGNEIREPDDPDEWRDYCDDPTREDDDED